jgi:hypothetical protein
MTMSSMRKHYLQARRAGRTQAEAMRETGVSRSSAGRWDRLLRAEDAARAEVLERVKASRAERENGADDALREAKDRDISIQGSFPMPSWVTSDGPAKLAQEDSVDAERFPIGLIERLERRENAGARTLPNNHPARRGVTGLRGAMPLNEDMSGRLSRPPRMPDEPPTGIMPV